MTASLVQAEFVDSIMQVCRVRMNSQSHAASIRLLTALVEWMPSALADNCPKRARVLVMLAESHLSMNKIDVSLQFINQALEIHYSADSFLFKLKVMLELRVGDDEIEDYFKTFKLTNERDTVLKTFRLVSDATPPKLAFNCYLAASKVNNIGAGK